MGCFLGFASKIDRENVQGCILGLTAPQGPLGKNPPKQVYKKNWGQVYKKLFAGPRFGFLKTSLRKTFWPAAPATGPGAQSALQGLLGLRPSPVLNPTVIIAPSDLPCMPPPSVVYAII